MAFRRLIYLIAVVIGGGVGLQLAGILPAPGQDKRRAAAYVTAAVERGDLRTTLSATGTLRALVTVEVGSQLSGQIAELLVEFNDEVKAGQPLARLDSSTFETEVRSAEAALEIARADLLKQRAEVQTAAAEFAAASHSREAAEAALERARAESLETGRDLERKRRLADSKVLAQAHIDLATTKHRSATAAVRAAEAEVEVARQAVLVAEAGQTMADANLLYARAAERKRAAELDHALIDLERTTITAPIDGIVIARDVDQGQTVAASLEAPTLFMLAQDLRRMEVHTSVDEADIGQIRVGQEASFTVDAYPGRAFAGAVTQIRKAPESIENVVTYTVVLSTRNPDLVLLPGMTALVNVVVEQANDVLKVANAALRFEPSDPTIVKRASAAAAPPAQSAVVWEPGPGGEPVAVPVTLGQSDGMATEIVDGALEVGQPVIVGRAPARDDGSWFDLLWRL